MVSLSVASLTARRSVAAALAARLGRTDRRAYAARGTIAAGLRLLLRAVLIVAGLVFGTLAAWQLGAGWGLLAAGVSCWVLEAVVKGDRPAAGMRGSP